MFHICHAADCGTLPAVLEKYNAGFTNAHARSLADAAKLGVDLNHNERCWLLKYFLELETGTRQEILERGLAPAPAEILDYLLQRRWRLSDGSKVPPTPGNTPASSSTVRNTLNSLSRVR